MNRLSFGSVTGTAIWIASAIKVLGYIWTSLAATYSASAFTIGSGSGGNQPNAPVFVPPLKRKPKPGQPGKKTRLPRPAPIPPLPAAPVRPPTGSPWQLPDPGFGGGIPDIVP